MTELAYRNDLAASRRHRNNHIPALRAALEEQRQIRCEQLAALAAADATGSALSREQAWDEVSDVIRDGASIALSEIDDALKRLDNGSYGACEGCEGQIPLARLKILPMARRCLRCQQVRETRACERNLKAREPLGEWMFS